MVTSAAGMVRVWELSPLFVKATGLLALFKALKEEPPDKVTVTDLPETKYLTPPHFRSSVVEGVTATLPVPTVL